MLDLQPAPAQHLHTRVRRIFAADTRAAGRSTRAQKFQICIARVLRTVVLVPCVCSGIPGVSRLLRDPPEFGLN